MNYFQLLEALDAYEGRVPTDPMVKARRDAAFAEREGSISIQEATKITQDSMFAVATGTGETIEAALASLAKAAG